MAATSLIPVQSLDDPAQRLQVAHAAFALFDIWLDHITGITDFFMALVAFGQLGLDEAPPVQAFDAFGETPIEIVVQRPLADQETPLHHAGADQHVALGQPEAVLGRPHRLPDLQPRSHIA